LKFGGIDFIGLVVGAGHRFITTRDFKRFPCCSDRFFASSAEGNKRNLAASLVETIHRTGDTPPSSAGRVEEIVNSAS